MTFRLQRHGSTLQVTIDGDVQAADQPFEFLSGRNRIAFAFAGVAQGADSPKVDINKATVQELVKLKGIGKKLLEKNEGLLIIEKPDK